MYYYARMTLQRMLKTIYDSGLSDYAIAKMLSVDGDKVSQPVVYRWRTGATKETTYCRHVRVEKLHGEVVTPRKDGD